MKSPAFIDISHHNTVPESFEATKAAGVLGVIHKATEGSTYVDDKLDNRHYLAQEAGMLWGVYHFVRPGSMQAQVQHFLKTVEPYSNSETLFCLDWEDTGVSLDDAVEFLQLLEYETGQSPVLYSGHVVKDALGGEPDPRLSKYRLWLCHYTEGEPVLPPGWDSYWAWQYTDQGSCPGVQSPVDLNAYDGMPAELIAEWSGAADTPEPEPEPEPDETRTITVIVPPGIDVRVITRKE